MEKEIRKDTEAVIRFGGTFLKWILISCSIGAIGGIVGAAFRFAVESATALRARDPWLIWLLPIGGLIIVFLYRWTGMEGEGTNNIINSIHAGERLPLLLVPVIFISTAITHLLGGSAGREGAALQIGGGIGYNVSRMFDLEEKEVRLAVLSGMSAVFAALFGTPITATVFALEISSVGIIHYSGLVPCVMASLTALGITRILGLGPEAFNVGILALEVDNVVRVVLLAVLCALVSVAFCQIMHFSEKQIRKWIRNPYLRAVIGGLLIILLTYLVGCRDYNGGGMEIVTRAIEHGQVKPGAFAFKILFTAITLSFGFKGGEVVPTFFIGATFGCLVAALFDIDPGIGGAIGLIATFCGAVNCPLASLIMAVELFGAGNFIFYAVACFTAYMLSGYSSLYQEQRIMYSKLKAEFINRRAE